MAIENGLGAVSVAGHAHCDRELDVRQAGSAMDERCAGGRDAAEQLGAPA
jgi:hypothetical protein